MTPHHENHSGSHCSQSYSLWVQAQLLTRFVTLRRRHHDISKDTNIIDNRHRELRQPYAGKSTKVRKLSWKSDTFSTRETTFVHRFFSTRCKLIRKSRTLRNNVNSTTTSMSRFAGNIFRLARIFVGKVEKNYLNTLTFGSHNFLFRAPICANLIPLERRHLNISNGTKHDLFWTPKYLQKLPQKRW